MILAFDVDQVAGMIAALESGSRGHVVVLGGSALEGDEVLRGLREALGDRVVKVRGGQGKRRLVLDTGCEVIAVNEAGARGRIASLVVLLHGGGRNGVLVARALAAATGGGIVQLRTPHTTLTPTTEAPEQGENETKPE